MQSTMTGESALITGASAGIGRATAQVFAREGANVALMARRERELRDVADCIEADYDVTATVHLVDVSDIEAVRSAVIEAAEWLGGLDIAVNNAGIAPDPRYGIDDLPVEQFRRVMTVNTFGMFYVSQAALSHLRRSGGQLIFAGSYAGTVPYPRDPVYAATKWWTRGFAKSLAGDVGDEGVGVSIVNPAEVRTEFGGEFNDDHPENKDRFSPGDVSEPVDVAEMIAVVAKQEQPNVVAEVDLFRRDKFSDTSLPE